MGVNIIKTSKCGKVLKPQSQQPTANKDTHKFFRLYIRLNGSVKGGVGPGKGHQWSELPGVRAEASLVIAFHTQSHSLVMVY